ncbi:amine sulfotransferase-like isoform X1 [Amblyraja radiata]|uniref:amine sulfotransferase-like isoform X1 n=1 Tax=Amblyraja radiata TaxID=386614 RepID=UPI001402B22C|nr:amine sulfotransferase-like isoform X1 [Amblyraja radiata]XP_032877021.1 amine sulfotransferase-like isoform X1 [Amblyraja radiata]XP_032877022.1 amine sulfotransferase-like isoform X1 [Amblyraja radiata]
MADSESDFQTVRLFNYKGCKMSGIHTIERLDQMENYEVRDSDVFVVTYPKSGTIWMQTILMYIFMDDDLQTGETKASFFKAPWLELSIKEINTDDRPPPRLFVTHLPYQLIPKALKNKKAKGSSAADHIKEQTSATDWNKLQTVIQADNNFNFCNYHSNEGGKSILAWISQGANEGREKNTGVIYVYRNPKDVAVSYYHFHKFANYLETPENFGAFLQAFLEGQVDYDSWFDHVKNWYNHREEFNIIFQSYEEMIKDLKMAVLKFCKFLGKPMDDKSVDAIVEHSTFKNMKLNPKTNYETAGFPLFNSSLPGFMRRGIIGDWKNNFTVAQNDMFNNIFQEKMNAIPLKFIWENVA